MKNIQPNSPGMPNSLHYYLSLIHAHTSSAWLQIITIAVMGLAALPSVAILFREVIRAVREITLCRMLARRTDLSANQYVTIAKLILRK